MRNFLFFCIIVMLSNGVAFTSEIDIKHVLPILKQKENTMHTFAWQSSSKIINKDTSEVSIEGDAMIAFNMQKHFQIKKQERRKWIGGETDILSYSFVATYDGKVLRSETKSKPGDTLPSKADIAEGIITKDTSQIHEYVNWRGSPECIGYFFPFVGCWADVDLPVNVELPKLSDVLELLVQQKKEIKISEDEKGIWHIMFPFFYLEDQKIQLYKRVDFDPSMGGSGAILSVQSGPAEIVNNMALEPFITFTMHKTGDFFSPSEVRILYDYDKKGRPNKYRHVKFANVVINEPLLDSGFQIDWQKGTNVYDHVAKKFYVVTGDPIDEAEAVRAFRDIQGLDRQGGLGENSSVLLFRLILITAGLALIAYALYIRFKKKNGS